MKKIIFILIILFFISCGKKMPPPSPDIFAPKLESAYYYINNQIKILFSEQLNTKMDSLNIIAENDSIISAEKYILNNVLYVQYKNDCKIKYLNLYGISDKYNNKKDFYKIKIKGYPIVDTIKPKMEKIINRDSVYIINYSEFINYADIQVYPEYIEYHKEIRGNTIFIHIKDTIMLYPIELIINNVKDLSENILNKRLIKYYIDDYDSSYTDSIAIESENIKDSFFIYNYDTIKIAKQYSDSSGIVKFYRLMPGSYFIGKDKSQLNLYYTESNE